MKAKFITVISALFLIVNSCDTSQKKVSKWIEIYKYSDVPPKRNETKKIGFYFSGNQTEINVYRYDSIVNTKLYKINLFDEITRNLWEIGNKKTSNTYIVEDGLLLSEGYLDFDFFEKHITTYLDNQETKTKIYIRLSSDKYDDFQLGYLEYFANSVHHSFELDKSVGWKIIDQINFSILTDGIYSNSFTLAQNTDGKFRLCHNDKCSVEFIFLTKY